MVLPSVKVTTALGSPDPVRVGSLVMRSLAEAPLSWLRLSLTAGAVVSRVKLRVALAVLPAVGVSGGGVVWATTGGGGVGDRWSLAAAALGAVEASDLAARRDAA